MRVQAVVFDLGNVLIHVDHGKLVRELTRHRNGESDALERMLAGDELLVRFESGEIEAEAFHEAICAAGRYTLDFRRFCEIYCGIFSPDAAMIEAHSALRRAGFRTLIFSNTSALHFEYIREQYAFMREFDDYVLSYRIGCMKPAPASYAAVERITGCVGDALLFLDDRSENVRGAALRGWRAIHHQSAESTLARLQQLGALSPEALLRS